MLSLSLMDAIGPEMILIMVPSCAVYAKVKFWRKTTFLNGNCVINSTHIPHSNVVAVYQNKNRDAINTAMFEKYCTINKPRNSHDIFGEANLVLMDNLEMADSAKTYVRVTSNEMKWYFY
jgi:hypothetical protein